MKEKIKQIFMNNFDCYAELALTEPRSAVPAMTLDKFVWVINKYFQQPLTEETEEGFKKPITVCLCGSGRFKEEFEKAEFEETLKGKIVLTIGCNTKDIARDIDWQHIKPMLDELHKRKIDLADEVFVINKNGYIGDSTRSEIEYAEKHHKEIIYLELTTN